MFNFSSIKFPEIFEIVTSMLILLSCIYSIFIDENIACTLTKCTNHSASTMTSIFPRAVAIGCMLCLFNIMHKNIWSFYEYQQKVDRYELIFPINTHKAHCRRVFIATIVSLSVVIILPTNVYRLILAHIEYRNFSIVLVFLFMYVQNACMCIMEFHFIIPCFDLYQKFQLINEDMCVLKSKSIITNRFPLVLKPEVQDNDRVDPCSNNDNDAGFATKTNEVSLVSSIELLRMRHKFISDLISDLNDLFNIQICSTLLVLFIMALLDIYYALISQSLKNKSNITLLTAWLLQYGFRFCMIVLMPNATTKQAYKAKSLITDINDRYTDKNAEEELRLFLNELSSRSMEFTTFHLFILNTRVLTSAILAGTTYLIILTNFR